MPLFANLGFGLAVVVESVYVAIMLIVMAVILAPVAIAEWYSTRAGLVAAAALGLVGTVTFAPVVGVWLVGFVLILIGVVEVQRRLKRRSREARRLPGEAG